MPKLTIVTTQDDDTRHISFSFTPGDSLRRILQSTDYWVRSGCINGACGLCLVRIQGGIVAGPAENERLLLAENQIAKGIRLACQVFPKDNLQIEIINKTTKSEWKTIPGDKHNPITVKPDDLLGFAGEHYYSSGHITHPYGVAVDLGTSSISLSLYDLSNGQLLTTRYGPNPQIRFGSDILTRLSVASESALLADEIQQIVIAVCKKMLWDITVHDGLNLKQITRLVFVGNTAMLTLLTGDNFNLLLDPKYWMSPITLLLPDTSGWASDWSIYPQAEITIIPPLAGFIGSDLTAGMLSISLLEEEAGSLLIDFGTNTEMALWDGKKLWTTSAAGGPAFEGCGISCGLPAETGAIYRLEPADNGELGFLVINGGKPLGICGSGLVDIFSHLLQSGQLTKIGKFTEDVPEKGYNVVNNDIRITKKDIDVIQRAKAAIGTAIQVLLSKGNMEPSDLKNVYIGGAFGYYLNISNAQRIGLLPQIDLKRFTLCGNTALRGCEHILLSARAAGSLKEITKCLEVVNLANCEDFDELFFHNLFLEPMV